MRASGVGLPAARRPPPAPRDLGFGPVLPSPGPQGRVGVRGWPAVSPVGWIPGSRGGDPAPTARPRRVRGLLCAKQPTVGYILKECSPLRRQRTQSTAAAHGGQGTHCTACDRAKRCRSAVHCLHRSVERAVLRRRAAPPHVHCTALPHVAAHRVRGVHCGPRCAAAAVLRHTRGARMHCAVHGVSRSTVHCVHCSGSACGRAPCRSARSAALPDSALHCATGTLEDALAPAKTLNRAVPRTKCYKSDDQAAKPA